MVVLEGPDGAGKSTVAKHLVENWEGPGGTTLTHHVANESLHSRVNREVVDELVYGQGMLTVFDRWFPSDFVYPEVQHRSPCLGGMDNWQEIWKTYGAPISERGLFVLFYEDPEVLAERRDLEVSYCKTISDRYSELFEDDWATVIKGTFCIPLKHPSGSIRARFDTIDYVQSVVDQIDWSAEKATKKKGKKT